MDSPGFKLNVVGPAADELRQLAEGHNLTAEDLVMQSLARFRAAVHAHLRGGQVLVHHPETLLRDGTLTQIDGSFFVHKE